MGKRIVVVGAGAVGSYTGAHMAKAGEDVTFVDFWPENVEAINRDGIRVTHHQGPQPFSVKARALHLTEAQILARRRRSTSPLSASSLTTPSGRRGSSSSICRRADTSSRCRTDE